MKKRTALHRILSVMMALAIIMTIPMTALAAETTGTVEVQTTSDKHEHVDVTIVIETTPVEGGTNTQTTVTADKVKTESGTVVNYDGTSDMTTDADGNTTGSAASSYDVSKDDYRAQGGSELELDAAAPEVTVDIPLEEGMTNAVEGSNTASSVEGDTPVSETDGKYNYTTTSVAEQGKVEVTTTEISTEVLGEEEQEYGYNSNLEYVKSDATADATNDLIIENGSAAPADPSAVEGGEGYDFVYAGSGNTSQFRPAIVFTEPLTEEEILEFNNPYIPLKHIKYFPTDLAVKDENGNYVTDADGYLLDKDGNKIVKNEKVVVGPDGETFYLHRIDNLGNAHYVEGWYQDGQWVEEPGGNKYGAVYASSQQFVLVDKKTGETITTYCADISTYTQDGFGYTMENLEDADYYTEEQAAQIRSIALNGYWGNEEGIGSLDTMKEMLRNAVDADGNRIFTDDEIDHSLTDGVALTATQMAIWSCSNEMEGVKFVNSHYLDTPDKTATSLTGPGGNIPAGKEDETLMMFKVYEYLKNLAPTEVDATSSETVITAENAIKDLSVTVIDKAQEHANNQDADSTNDAYVTNLSFALVVTPSTENGDDMIVRIISNGEVLKEARIAGSAKEGETMEILTCDENGNYNITGITLIEGEQEFNITLEGIQNLEKGVYLYSSEVKTVDEEEVSSQTMVGLASGEHAVNVSMSVKFDLDVEDEVVATEKVWRSEHHVPTYPVIPANEEPDETEPEETVPVETEPEEEIEEEEVPLGEAPKTGDISMIYVAMAMVSLIGLAALYLIREKGRA